VIQSGSDTATSAVAVFKKVPAPDDAGAQTADRYEWQAMMATADVLAAYLQHLDDAGVFADSETFRVICELHEDWALLEEDSVELVSAKHREASDQGIGMSGVVEGEVGQDACHGRSGGGRPHGGAVGRQGPC
jgi:hypothetical protein